MSMRFIPFGHGGQTIIERHLWFEAQRRELPNVGATPAGRTCRNRRGDKSSLTLPVSGNFLGDFSDRNLFRISHMVDIQMHASFNYEHQSVNHVIDVNE